MNKTITLNNGVEMPLMGYGVWQIAPAECEQYVSEALKAGYRSIDTAQAYYNEEGVGEAISKSGIPRGQLFLTTKVWISNAGEEKAARSIEESLRKLKTAYIDLLLIHQPFGDYYGTYRAMEKAYKAGKVRAIGLSNFYDARFVDLAENMEVKPAVVQLETHVFSQQVKMRELMKEYGTRLRHTPDGLESTGARHEQPVRQRNAESHCREARQGHRPSLPEIPDGRRHHRHSAIYQAGAHGQQFRLG